MEETDDVDIELGRTSSTQSLPAGPGQRRRVGSFTSHQFAVTLPLNGRSVRAPRFSSIDSHESNFPPGAAQGRVVGSRKVQSGDDDDDDDDEPATKSSCCENVRLWLIDNLVMVTPLLGPEVAAAFRARKSAGVVVRMHLAELAGWLLVQILSLVAVYNTFFIITEPNNSTVGEETQHQHHHSGTAVPADNTGVLLQDAYYNDYIPIRMMYMGWEKDPTTLAPVATTMGNLSDEQNDHDPQQLPPTILAAIAVVGFNAVYDLLLFVFFHKTTSVNLCWKTDLFSAAYVAHFVGIYLCVCLFNDCILSGNGHGDTVPPGMTQRQYDADRLLHAAPFAGLLMFIAAKTIERLASLKMCLMRFMCFTTICWISLSVVFMQLAPSVPKLTYPSLVTTLILIVVSWLHHRVAQKAVVQEFLRSYKVALDNVCLKWPQIKAEFCRVNFNTKLGAGSAGQLFVGSYCGQPVAVKELYSSAVQQSLTEEFMQESSIWAHISHHPNIVRYFGMTVMEGRTLLVSELCHLSLRSVVDPSLAGRDIFIKSASFGFFRAIEVLQVVRDVCCALSQLHGDGIAHHDIKLGNILLQFRSLDSTERAFVTKVCDFGLTSRISDDIGEKGAGTVAFLPPEAQPLIAATPTKMKATQANIRRSISEPEPHRSHQPPALTAAGPSVPRSPHVRQHHHVRTWSNEAASLLASAAEILQTSHHPQRLKQTRSGRVQTTGIRELHHQAFTGTSPPLRAVHVKKKKALLTEGDREEYARIRKKKAHLSQPQMPRIHKSISFDTLALTPRPSLFATHTRRSSDTVVAARTSGSNVELGRLSSLSPTRNGPVTRPAETAAPDEPAALTEPPTLAGRSNSMEECGRSLTDPAPEPFPQRAPSVVARTSAEKDMQGAPASAASPPAAAAPLQWFAPRATTSTTILSDMVTNQVLKDLKMRPRRASSHASSASIRSTASASSDPNDSRRSSSLRSSVDLSLHQQSSQKRDDGFYSWDMFSLGIVVWSLLQHALPWPNCSTKEIAELVTNGQRPTYSIPASCENPALQAALTADRQQQMALVAQLRQVSKQCWCTTPSMRPRAEDVLNGLAPASPTI